jgi:hypothetical protein
MCRGENAIFVEQALPTNRGRRNLMYGNVTARREKMDGKRIHKVESERPIAKPDYPLPALFTPSKRAELPTRRRQQDSGVTLERAHFYKKRTSQSGSPVYDFFITTGDAGRDARQD